jgi:NAD(P)-dependent dehydrogenase (short-subunit alcohol dehydrogenase family)
VDFMDERIAALLDLDGRHALVTGGATGLGEAIARTLAAAGAQVTIGDIDLVGAERVADAIGGSAIRLDVTNEDVVEDLIDALDGVDILVNNAGSYREAGSILDQPYDSWRRIIDVNLAGVFLCSQAVARKLVADRRQGSIITIASVDGLLPCLGTGYDTAKAGAIHFTRTLALDLAPHGIRVNAVNPGNVPVPTLTKMSAGEIPHFWPADSAVTGLMGPVMMARTANIPLGRKGQPDDIANAVLFLASDAASYITGQAITVDGGWTLV